MSALEYIVNSGAWSLGGLVAGYFLGRLERDVLAIKKRLYEKGEADDDA